MKLIALNAIFSCAVQVASLGVMQAQDAPAGEQVSIQRRATLALSPAVTMRRAKPGQSITQTLTIANQLPIEMRFMVEVQDVVVKDGKRAYVPAGQVPSSIASAAIIAPLSVIAPAGQSMSVNVTLTVPPDTRQRAVVVFFKGQLADAKKGSVGFGASLGALITLTLSDDAKIVTGPLKVTPQTASANVGLSEELENTGSEPVVPTGVIAILDEHGKRVAKAAFEPHRLLPGERGLFSATSPALLTPGQYRGLSSFEYEGKVLTNAGEFGVSQ